MYSITYKNPTRRHKSAGRVIIRLSALICPISSYLPYQLLFAISALSPRIDIKPREDLFAVGDDLFDAVGKDIELALSVDRIEAAAGGIAIEAVLGLLTAAQLYRKREQQVVGRAGVGMVLKSYREH